ncbi:hypothetical protein BDR07DRAFT_1463125 [Suillus spraguei]|nr:hypothetical protein BDR07DRAFT_1463125 [Suillus spraguei]
MRKSVTVTIEHMLLTTATYFHYYHRQDRLLLIWARSSTRRALSTSLSPGYQQVLFLSLVSAEVWFAFTRGGRPWDNSRGKVNVFGPEDETDKRAKVWVFWGAPGRHCQNIWEEGLEFGGMTLEQKVAQAMGLGCRGRLTFLSEIIELSYSNLESKDRSLDEGEQDDAYFSLPITSNLQILVHFKLAVTGGMVLLIA